MTVPYTYYLFHRPTNKKYYGVRWAKNCCPDDLWKIYFSSSKHVKLLIKEYGKDSFNFNIRKIFSSKEEAIEWERKVLLRLKVLEKKDWLNKNISGCIINDVHPMKGKHHNEDTKQKIKLARQKQIFTDETKIKMSEVRKGKKFSNKHKENLSKSLFGENNPMYGKTPHNKGVSPEKFPCNICGKIVDYRNLNRWHNNNCKQAGFNG